ncbi:MAG: RluA family pseudouridine synthase [Simkaniaceae bacterium]|nr:RluA family pseudouridine synthase [Simkaniaceae bacterium]MCF7853036.1 RluA family pseudouridine synthase [Simkaniaceae bacterium]
MKLLDKLKLEYPESSSSQIKKWILQGRILLNGRSCKKPHQLTLSDDKVMLENHRQPPLQHDIQILYADKDLVVINKPAGLLSVNLDKEDAPNAHDILKRHFKPKRVFPVHRLDRETSGILVFALNEKARDHLKEQFFDHSIKRQYRAIVQGKVSPQQGTWMSRLIEDPSLKVHVTHSHRGKMAITHYEVVKQSDQFSELLLTLETGRKNQIRAQAHDIGHPIVGDIKYGATANTLSRLALHAIVLEFDHPTLLKRKRFYIPADKVFDCQIKNHSLQ